MRSSSPVGARRVDVGPNRGLIGDRAGGIGRIFGGQETLVAQHLRERDAAEPGGKLPEKSAPVEEGASRSGTFVTREVHLASFTAGTAVRSR